MTTDDRAVTVHLPGSWLWVVRIGGALLGFGAGFAVAPLVGWMLDLIGDAPGPLRLAAQLPTVWSVPVMTVAGAVGGAWLAAAWRKESPVVTVATGHVEVRQRGGGLHVGRAEVDTVFTDGRDLVVLGRGGPELARVPAGDLPTARLRAAFDGLGYPWRGTADPREFVRWVDRGPDLDEPAHSLLRARKRALADKRAGAAEEALDGLRAMGLAVRDRGGAQEYHRPPR